MCVSVCAFVFVFESEKTWGREAGSYLCVEGVRVRVDIGGRGG